MTDENIELISNNDGLNQDQAEESLQNKRRPSVAWTEEAKPPTEREAQPLDTKKILVDQQDESEGSQGNAIECNTDDAEEIKSKDSDYTPVETK